MEPTRVAEQAARILLVDQDPQIRLQIRDSLADCSWMLIDAESVDHAIELGSGSPLDLVLLSGELGSNEVVWRLKALANDFLPVVLVGESAARPNRRADVDDFVALPLSGPELRARVANQLTLRMLRSELARKQSDIKEALRFQEERLSRVIHDLRNPMAVVLSNIDYTLDELGGREAMVIEALADARTAGHRVLRQFANLLDTARMEAGSLSLRYAPVELAGLLTSIADSHRVAQNASDIQLEMIMPPNVRVQLDVDLITRAIENVLDNAVRYTPPGGRLRMEAKVVDGAVQIRFANTGEAIPIQARNELFDRPQPSGPPHSPNRDLGLYFCRMAAEAHGGRLWIEEAPSFPVVFVLELPA